MTFISICVKKELNGVNKMRGDRGSERKRDLIVRETYITYHTFKLYKFKNSKIVCIV